MSNYLPWLTEAIKKKTLQYLLHNYFGQFFEKLSLEQMSIDIYHGKGSVTDLILNVDGLNQDLDFVPFKFLDGCTIDQISVEVPWKSLSKEHCKVELEGATFICRLKTPMDLNKAHCTESSLLSRSLMTDSYYMASQIVKDDDDVYDSPSSSVYMHNMDQSSQPPELEDVKREGNIHGLHMFAQLIDSVLRRTKLTARNTLFQIQPQVKPRSPSPKDKRHNNAEDDDDFETAENTSDDEDNDNDDAGDAERAESNSSSDNNHPSQGTVEFWVEFFCCEEILEQDEASDSKRVLPETADKAMNDSPKKVPLPENITKMLTLENVVMRIDGKEVSNLKGTHTITIKFNGQKSEISVFSGSPLLAVIDHQELGTFLRVFDSKNKNSKNKKNQHDDEDYNEDDDDDDNFVDKNETIMDEEDYAKIQNQLLDAEKSTKKFIHLPMIPRDNCSSPYTINRHNLATNCGGRMWSDSPPVQSTSSPSTNSKSNQPDFKEAIESTNKTKNLIGQTPNSINVKPVASSLEHLDAFSCELKLPGIWLCLIKDDDSCKKPTIDPFDGNTHTFETINKHIDNNIRVAHIRVLADKVSLDITSSRTQLFIGDLDISEHLDASSTLNSMRPVIHLLESEEIHQQEIDDTYATTDNSNTLKENRYKALILNNYRDIIVNCYTKTRLTLDPTLIDRLVFDYKLFDTKVSKQIGDSDDEVDGRDKMMNNLIRRDHRLGSLTSSAADARKMALKKVSKKSMDLLTMSIKGEQFKFELLCPIPDLTPEGLSEPSQIRPQSFLFELEDVELTYKSDKLTISATDLSVSVKSQPKQQDHEAVRFVEATRNIKLNDKIIFTLEPSPSRLESAFTNECEQALKESTMFDSIYVGSLQESRLPTQAFQTRRKVVRSLPQSSSSSSNNNNNSQPQSSATKSSTYDNENILTPGDRQHLSEYLNQIMSFTKLSISFHLPICEVEFEDKEQLDLIYNRFANDFVFWLPKAFGREQKYGSKKRFKKSHKYKKTLQQQKRVSYNDKINDPDRTICEDSDDDEDDDATTTDDESEQDGDGQDDDSKKPFGGHCDLGVDCYENEATCKVTVDDISVKFGHQSCAAALKQEISSKNLLFACILDVNKRPNTIISLVTDNLELYTDNETVLGGNSFVNDKSSIFSMTAEIKRPNRKLKTIKLAIKLENGLFNDFRMETCTRFWQSISVTDEPILGYLAPTIAIRLYVDIMDTSLMLAKKGSRPALLTIDELYVTSMVSDEKNQTMIRMIADEMALYLKRNRDELTNTMKNYVCLIDTGLVDLDLKFSPGLEGNFEFNIMNNVINVRVCQDSLSALCKLLGSIVKEQQQPPVQTLTGHQGQPQSTAKNSSQQKHLSSAKVGEKGLGRKPSNDFDENVNHHHEDEIIGSDSGSDFEGDYEDGHKCGQQRDVQVDLFEDAMNEFTTDEDMKSKAPKPTVRKSQLEQELATMNIRNQQRQSNFGQPQTLDSSSNDDSNSLRLRSSGASVSRDVATGDKRQDHDDDDDDEDHDDDDSDRDQQDYEDDSEEAYSNDYDGQADQDEEEKEGQEEEEEEDEDKQCERVPLTPAEVARRNDWLLDESTHQLVDMSPQPLQPTPLQGSHKQDYVSDLEGLQVTTTPPPPQFGDDNAATEQLSGSSSLQFNPSNMTSSMSAMPIDESGFFVIGDDDVGAGILDKHHNCEPQIRKLIDGPINVITDYLKTTKPRALPDMLQASLERYVLEEMTLVVSLFGGRDFDDNEYDLDVEDTATSMTTTTTSSGPDHHATTLDGSKSSSPSVTMGSDFDLTSCGGDSASLGSACGHPNGGLHSTRRHHDSESAVGAARRRAIQVKQQRRSRHQSESAAASAALNLNPSYASNTTNSNSNSSLSKPDQPKVHFGNNPAAYNNANDPVWESLDLEAESSTRDRPHRKSLSSSKLAGGTWRRQDVSIQLILNKVKVLYEIGRFESPISWRFLLFVTDVEIRDRIHASDINKMLYEYCTETMPKRDAPMIQVKNVATINPSDGCEECDLRVSVKPLRLNVDQDTLLFLIDFFTTFSKSLKRRQPLYGGSGATGSCDQMDSNSNSNSKSGAARRPSARSREANLNQEKAAAAEASRAQPGQSAQISARERQVAPKPRSRASKIGQQQQQQQRDCGARVASDRNCNYNDEQDYQYSDNQSQRPTQDRLAETHAGRKRSDLQQPAANGVVGRQSRRRASAGSTGSQGSSGSQPIYIKSFTFSPEVPIRLDYHAKHLDFEQGALAGILMGLAHLDHSELVLTRLHAKHGMRGLDRLALFVLNHWLADIKRNQLPSILSGVGPMHSVIQLLQGMRDLVWLPIEHYRRDKRLVRGLQRGAASFSSSTAMAAISLVNRFISVIQCTAQIAHDIVTPPGTAGARADLMHLDAASAGNHHHRGHHAHHLVATGGSLASRRRHQRQAAAAAAAAASGKKLPGAHLYPATAADSFGVGVGALGSGQGGAGINQPRNFCEGVAVGYNILRDGFQDTARNVAVGMQADDMRSAVGELVRQIPSTFLSPIISVTEGAQNVLVGMRNQIAPDARREDQDKWKRRVRGK